MFKRKFSAGDWVRVRRRDEILATLDSNGCLDGMPVMPEMLRHCGATMRVAARAHKTCDTVNNTGGVWVGNAVHLEGARCGGSSHGDCQAACMIFWHQEWLQPVSASEAAIKSEESFDEHLPELPREWSLKSSEDTPERETIYRCQATELPQFVQPMKWWDIRQYLEDITSRNIGLRSLFRGMWHSLSHAIITLGIGYGAWKSIYNRIMRLSGGDPFYWVTGRLTQTPSRPLHLEPGDWVRIKPFDEIIATLDTSNKNRGLGFDTGEMGMFCGQTVQVDKRLERFINDRTGKMVFMKEPTVTLKGIYCSGERSNVRKFCPRAITSYWRETWLERVTPESAID